MPYLFLFLPFFNTMMATYVAAPNEQLIILPGSTLTLEGETNVRGFQCGCEGQFPPLPYQVSVENGQALYFSSTRLPIPVRALDCGNRLMNRDLYEALGAPKHPYINITPLEAKLLPAKDGWTAVSSLVKISIGGVENVVQLHALAKQEGQRLWQIKACHDLDMEDFGIQPPAPMGGLIKVDEQITITLDLLVKG